MPNVYNPGQFKIVHRFLPKWCERPEWLILGGPSCGDEAQTAAMIYPWIKVIACEPSRHHYQWQKSNMFPRSGKLLPVALMDYVGDVSFHTLGENEPSGGSVKPDCPTVPCTTLDTLDTNHGPFDKAVLWLDIEGSELAALKGGRALLSSGRVGLINLEVCDRDPVNTIQIAKLLGEYGYYLTDEWNNRPGAHRDQIWTLEK